MAEKRSQVQNQSNSTSKSRTKYCLGSVSWAQQNWKPIFKQLYRVRKTIIIVISNLTSTLNCCATLHVADCVWLFRNLNRFGTGPFNLFFLRNAEVDNEINESCQCTAFILHNQFLDPKDTDIQKRDRFQKIIMISNGRVELLAKYSFDKWSCARITKPWRIDGYCWSAVDACERRWIVDSEEE